MNSTEAESSSSWVRPHAGRAISGVALLLARRTGLGTGMVRWAFSLAFLLGLFLIVWFGIFADLSRGTRAFGAALGALLCFVYPLAALLLPVEPRRSRWDFGSTAAVLTLLTLVGQAMGVLMTPYWVSAKGAWQERGLGGFFTWFGEHGERVGWGGRDVVFVLFLVSAGVFVWLQRKAVRELFRSMYAGVCLVTGITLAVLAGVLVPQIDGFEDPDQRVDLAREYEDYKLFKERGYQKLPAHLTDGHEQYQTFRWAQGYFLYHVGHLYGVGMPTYEMTPAEAERLEQRFDAFGQRYGFEERDNRWKSMLAARTGSLKLTEIASFLQRNEDVMWRFFESCTVLQLNRTYKSAWFASLMTLLFVAVCFNTFKGSWRQWFSVQKLGFFTVHMGIMVLLIGGFVSKLFTDRGLLQLFKEAPPQDTYYRHHNPNKKARLPFKVGLDEFARVDWKGLRVDFLEDEFASMPPVYTLWEGKQWDLDFIEEDGASRPRLRLRVDELHHRARMTLPKVVPPDEGDEGVALAEIDVVFEERRVPWHLYTISPSDYMMTDPRMTYRLSGRTGPADPEAMFPKKEGVLGVLGVDRLGSGQVEPSYHDLSLGATIETEDGYLIEVVDATAAIDPRFTTREGSRHPLPLEKQRHELAAVWVDVSKDGENKERRIIGEGIDPVSSGAQERFFHRELVLQMDWDPWTAPGGERFLLHWDEGQDPVLIAQDGTRLPVQPGQFLPLPEEGVKVLLKDLHTNVALEKSIEFIEPEERYDDWDQDFYSRDPRGLALSVILNPDTPEERTERVRFATTSSGSGNTWFSPDGRVRLTFEEKGGFPFEWRSVLSIWRPDEEGELARVELGSERQREIRVNDYYTHDGWRFFQTNADPNEPGYSGVGVVYDPGIPLVLIGMYTIIVGTMIAFLLRPIVLARRERVKVAS